MDKARAKVLHSARTASHTTSINASRVATIGIDIGKNTFHLVASINAVQLFCRSR